MKDFENTPLFASMPQSPLGYEAHHVLTESMEVTQYHCHDYYEFYLHLRGGELMGVDTKQYTLKPNQLFVLPPFFMHGLSCTTELHNYERAYLNISPEVMSNLGCGQIDLAQFFRSHASLGRFTYQLAQEETDCFVSGLEKIKERNYLKTSDPAERFGDYSVMIGILSMVMRIMGGSAPEESEPLSGSIIQDVLTYINNHFNENLSVNELARLFSVSTSWLAHEFTRFTHRSIYNYILYRRITLARQLMLGDDSLNDIAYQCGFNDYSNFLRAFSNTTGVSPNQYRKQLHMYHKREV
jgi:AraC-like DNA-binding protein